jgi:hypothetical protein
MKDDYLWDGSGEPDPEIQRLETKLARFRSNRPAPAFHKLTESRPRLSWLSAFNTPGSLRLVAATAMLLVVAVLGILASRQELNSASRPGWDVERFAGGSGGGPDSLIIFKEHRTSRLGIGQVLETSSKSRATIRQKEIGEVGVEPNTRLRLLETGSGKERLALDRGTIHAAIWAPSGDFVVDTPSAVAVDLGCSYTLQVDDSGAGTLRTTLGWVGFKLEDREAFIPAGAMCITEPKVGPGTPYFEDAPESFRAALFQFDFNAPTPEQRSALLNLVLTQARKQDALTIWHLLTRAVESDRGRVFERLSLLLPPPTGVTRHGILRLDPRMLDLWWNELGLGDISLWRTWERSGSQSENGAK